MTDYVISLESKKYSGRGRWDEARYEDAINYAKLLKTPLNLGMFVPCDAEGNILEIHPKQIQRTSQTNFDALSKYEDDFKIAQDKVLFEGFQVRKQNDYYVLSKGDNIIWLSWNKSKNVEYLLKMTNEVELDRLAWEEKIK